MSLKTYLINVLVAFILYGLLMTLYGSTIMASSMAAMADLMVPQDDPKAMVVLVWHLVQTMVMVWLWGRFATKDKLEAAKFGFMFGLLVAATDMVWYYGMKIPQDPKSLMFIGHLIVASLVAVGLSLIHKPADRAAQ